MQVVKATCSDGNKVIFYIGLDCVSPLYVPLLTFTHSFSFFLFSLQLVVFNFVLLFVSWCMKMNIQVSQATNLPLLSQ